MEDSIVTVTGAFPDTKASPFMDALAKPGSRSQVSVPTNHGRAVELPRSGGVSAR